MNKLNLEPNPTSNGKNTSEPASTGTTLVTMILLIAGLLLATTIMHQQIIPQADPNPKQALNLATIVQNAKLYASKINMPNDFTLSQHSETSTTSSTGKSNRFSKRTNVRWPKLKLTGFGSSADGTGGFAILNGEQIVQGQLLDGKVKLVKIQAQDVVVEYKGEQKTISPGTQY